MDWGYWLGRKYGVMEDQNRIDAEKARTLQYQADTSRLGTVADANLANVRAGLLPKQAEADIRRSNSEAAFTDIQAKMYPELTRANIGGINARAFNDRAQGGLYGEQAGIQRQLGTMMKRNPSILGGSGIVPEDRGSLFERVRTLFGFGMGN